MKIAFDSHGTLIHSPHSKRVIEFLWFLKNEGHEVIVWSNSIDFAQEAAGEAGIDLSDAFFKVFRHDVDQDHYIHLGVDVAVDDRCTLWLDAKAGISVEDLVKLADFSDWKSIIKPNKEIQL